MAEISTSKQMILIGGPNGSGKSTFAEELLESHDLHYISADDIAFELNPSDPYSVRLQAGREFFRQLNTSIKDEKSILIESTLAGKSLESIIRNSRNKHGYRVTIIYIFLKKVETCIQRVAERVEKGGHHVPEDDVIRRYNRSLNNFWNLYKQQADHWYLYYNGSDNFEEFAYYIPNNLHVLNDDLFRNFKEMVTSDERD
ncbi:MAG: AAA family ATPase [Balneolaceae bacterium]|nr:AAA family ATPase [Balneolaceae bacterium]